MRRIRSSAGHGTSAAAINAANTDDSPAMHWIRAQLEAGPLDRKAIQQRATEDGLAMRTVERAAVRLHVRKQRSGQGVNHRSLWTLSASTPATQVEAAARAGQFLPVPDNGASGGTDASAEEPTGLLRVIAELERTTEGDPVMASSEQLRRCLDALSQAQLRGAMQSRVFRAFRFETTRTELRAILNELRA